MTAQGTDDDNEAVGARSNTVGVSIGEPDEEGDEPSVPGPALETFLCANLNAQTGSAMTGSGSVSFNSRSQKVSKAGGKASN